MKLTANYKNASTKNEHVAMCGCNFQHIIVIVHDIHLPCSLRKEIDSHYADMCLIIGMSQIFIWTKNIKGYF